MRRFRLRFPLSLLAQFCLAVGFNGAASALSVNTVQSYYDVGPTVIVVIEILGEGDVTDPGGYALVFDYSLSFPNATAHTTAGPDPNAQFGQAAACNLGAQNCIGANGGVFGTFVISDSINTFTLSGLPPSYVVNWTTENSSGLSAAPSLPSGSITVMPEPASGTLLGLGLTALAVARRRPRVADGAPEAGSRPGPWDTGRLLNW